MPERGAARRRGWVVWGVALALGLLLRVWFVTHPMPLDDDTDVYAELAQNWFHHGVYGLAADGVIEPTLIRLPGYPLFLAGVFSVFGWGNFAAVIWAQVAIDLLGCWLIARFVREHVSQRAGTWAIFLAALCPFTAAYATICLTECLSVFAVSLALWSTGRVLRAMAEARLDRLGLAALSAALAMATLLRPDGALVTVAAVAAVFLCGWRRGRVGLGLRAATVCGLLAVLPLAPWAVRNWRTFGVIQPLAPRRVNDPGEYVTYGFYRWMSTWAVDIVSTGNVFWRVGTAEIDVRDLPSRAFDSPVQRRKTEELLAAYNTEKTVTPALDARFGALAGERLSAHPWLCRVWVPMLRVGDMWLRPRTETLGLDADWWRFDKHREESMEAVGLGLLNLALVVAALVGVVRVVRSRPGAGWIVLPVVYVALRCVLLSTMENSEPRYTLEAFPFVLALAACGCAGGSMRSRPEGELAVPHAPR